MEKNKFTHGSLFSGIGGPEIAAEEMGWKNMFHCEINPFGRKILDYWFPNSKSYEDITKTNFTEWRGKINVLTGGFPCQPFSCAGQRKGYEIAKEIMKGFSANSHNQCVDASSETLAQWSISGADALIAELKKGGKG